MKLILDYAKWRCGFYGKYQLGVGSTTLLNDEGYMCCLGQWSQQLGAVYSELINKTSPVTFKRVLLPLTNFSNGHVHNSELSIKAMEINDNEYTTIGEKLSQLTELLKTHNIELEVINMPK